MANTLQELPVYLKAREFHVAVAAIIARPAFGRNRKLHEQIADANESILANMEEGFEQSTDRGLEKYLFDAKGSTAEVVTRLNAAYRKHYITHDELVERTRLGEELGRMLGGWIKYLARSGWTDRGRHGVEQSRTRRP